MPDITKEKLVKLYVAFFGRAPTPAGIEYWKSYSNLKTLSEVSKSFFDQPETKKKYPNGLTNEEFMTEIYSNLFNRAPQDNEELYWVKELDNHHISRNNMILAVINGARNKDATVLDNKTTVALHYMDSDIADTGGFFLDKIDATPESVTEAIKLIDYLATNPKHPGNGNGDNGNGDNGNGDNGNGDNGNGDNGNGDNGNGDNGDNTSSVSFVSVTANNSSITITLDNDGTIKIGDYTKATENKTATIDISALAKGQNELVALDSQNKVAKSGYTVNVGDDSADTLEADATNTSNKNLMYGLGGDDTITGSDNDDNLYGDAGNDTLIANGGDDHLEGGAGSDTLRGGAGTDEMQGGAGGDTYIYASGDITSNEVLKDSGSDGTDILKLDNGVDFSGMTDGSGNQKIKSDMNIEKVAITNEEGNGDPVVTLSALQISGENIAFTNEDGSHTAQVNINGIPYGENIDLTTVTIEDDSGPLLFNIKGMGGNDEIIATNKNDTIDGGDGNDVLDGKDGDDIITGGNDNDSITGGLGSDTLDGGEDGDLYIYNINDIGSNEKLKDTGSNGTDTIKIANGINFAQINSDGTSGTKLNSEVGIEKITTFNPDNSETYEVYFNSTQLSGETLVVRNSDFNHTVTVKINNVNGESVDLSNITVDNTGGDVIFETTALGDSDGTSGDDNLNGGDGDDTINGGDGDDNINGGDGDDTLNGDDGDDTISGGDGDDTIDGGDGNDDLNGGDGDDNISGGDGDDTIDGGDGDDTIDGGTGDDTIDGGDGNDDIQGGDGDDTIDGGTGDDTIDGGAGDDDIQGGDGNDNIDGGSGNDEISGGNGDDTINGVDDNDTINGDDGDDTLNGDTGDDVINGGDGNDTIDGGTGDDTIDGGNGDDTIDGGEGSDTIDGGDGNDTIDGGNGNDNIDGGKGQDTIHGGDGDDTIDGGDDEDTIYGDDGNDTIDGGDGNDYIEGNAGNDTINGNGGDDRIRGGAGEDELIGGTGSDKLCGEDDNDKLYGGTGSDEMFGGEGDDLFSYTPEGSADYDYDKSGLGDDIIIGGAGSDEAHGGEDSDTYFYDVGDIGANEILKDRLDNPTNDNGTDRIVIADGVDFSAVTDGNNSKKINSDMGIERIELVSTGGDQEITFDANQLSGENLTIDSGTITFSVPTKECSDKVTYTHTTNSTVYILDINNTNNKLNLIKVINGDPTHINIEAHGGTDNDDMTATNYSTLLGEVGDDIMKTSIDGVEQGNIRMFGGKGKDTLEALKNSSCDINNAKFTGGDGHKYCIILDAGYTDLDEGVNDEIIDSENQDTFYIHNGTQYVDILHFDKSDSNTNNHDKIKLDTINDNTLDIVSVSNKINNFDDAKKEASDYFATHKDTEYLVIYDSATGDKNEYLFGQEKGTIVVSSTIENHHDLNSDDFIFV